MVRKNVRVEGSHMGLERVHEWMVRVYKWVERVHERMVRVDKWVVGFYEGL